VAATPVVLDAAAAGDAVLADVLNARLPLTWPPEHYDAGVVSHTRDMLHRDPASAAWTTRFFVSRDPGGSRTLVGVGGYKGSPVNGAVEIGYSIVAEHQRRGLGSEAARGLVRHAFAQSGVHSVTAQTLPGLTASILVLVGCGFTLVGEGDEPGVIRYELRRDP